MKRLLLATAALLVFSGASQAAVVGDLGVNPTSSQGAFSNQNLPTGSFADQWTFQLVGENIITIGSATNVYPQASDFIAKFNGSVYDIVGAIDAVPGTGDDILVLGRRSLPPAIAVWTARYSAVRPSSRPATTTSTSPGPPDRPQAMAATSPWLLLAYRNPRPG